MVPDVLVLTGDLMDNSEIEGYSAIAAQLATQPFALEFPNIKIIGMMVKSHLVTVNQGDEPGALVYGQSETDACIVVGMIPKRC